MPKIYLRLYQTCDYDEREPGQFGEWEQKYSFNDVYAFRDDSTSWYEKVVKLDRAPGDLIWIVVENISDGDSFGHCLSEFHIRAAFSSEKEAIDYTSNDENKCTDYFAHHNEWLICKRTIRDACFHKLNDGVRYA